MVWILKSSLGGCGLCPKAVEIDFKRFTVNYRQRECGEGQKVGGGGVLI